MVASSVWVLFPHASAPCTRRKEAGTQNLLFSREKSGRGRKPRSSAPLLIAFGYEKLRAGTTIARRS